MVHGKVWFLTALAIVDDIAAVLVISPHTVHRHINHIFAKTGATNRVEAAAYARRQGPAG